MFEVEVEVEGGGRSNMILRGPFVRFEVVDFGGGRAREEVDAMGTAAGALMGRGSGAVGREGGGSESLSDP